eukprot:s3474_g6.t1
MAAPGASDTAFAAEVQAEVDEQVALSRAAEHNKVTSNDGAPSRSSSEQPSVVAGGSVENRAPTGVETPETKEVKQVVTCAKCRTDGHALADVICRDGYRAELRYAALERRNSCDNRLCFGHSRALLKKTMVHEVMSIKKDSQDSEWQPLSYYELKGHDTSRIEQLCPCEEHPVLGPTYKLSVHMEKEGTVVKDCLVQMENDAAQRKVATVPSPGVPQVDLELAIEIPDKKT